MSSEYTRQEAQSRTGLLAPLRLFADLLFPQRCAGCGRVDYDWCDTCLHQLTTTPYLHGERIIAPLVAVASTGEHTGRLRDAVRALKYENLRRLAAALGERLLYRLNQLDWTIDIVLPLPLHTTRYQQRGYNQSQLLSEYVAKSAGLAYSPVGVYRQRDTRSQVGLTQQERLMNVAQAFAADPHIVEHKTILVIDDVCTTGATLSACAAALQDAGAHAVYGLTVTAAVN